MTPFEAIADPTRRALLDILRAEGPQKAGNLAGRFGEISRPAVSKHLRVLTQAALVQQRREGRENWYSLNPIPLSQVHAWVQNYEGFWRARLDKLKEIVEGDS